MQIIIIIIIIYINHTQGTEKIYGKKTRLKTRS